MAKFRYRGLDLTCKPTEALYHLDKALWYAIMRNGALDALLDSDPRPLVRYPFPKWNCAY